MVFVVILASLLISGLYMRSNGIINNHKIKMTMREDMK